MEKHGATSFVNYLVHSELLYDLQSAFCEGHFTESALIKVTNKILFTLDPGRSYRNDFCRLWKGILRC